MEGRKIANSKRKSRNTKKVRKKKRNGFEVVYHESFAFLLQAYLNKYVFVSVRTSSFREWELFFFPFSVFQVRSRGRIALRVSAENIIQNKMHVMRNEKKRKIEK